MLLFFVFPRDEMIVSFDSNCVLDCVSRKHCISSVWYESKCKFERFLCFVYHGYSFDVLTEILTH